MKIIQPRLDFVDPSIASRLKWIHGDLCVALSRLSRSANSFISLEGLPFSTNRFDFVRVSGVGLGIPEDEVCHYQGHECNALTVFSYPVAIRLGS